METLIGAMNAFNFAVLYAGLGILVTMLAAYVLVPLRRRRALEAIATEIDRAPDPPIRHTLSQRPPGRVLRPRGSRHRVQMVGRLPY